MSDGAKRTIAGIDLGTTYSCIAYIDETGNPIVAKNRGGGSTTPSVVFFPEDEPGKCTVGQSAKEQAVLSPERTAQFVKSQIGREKVALTVDGVEYSPQGISAKVLEKVSQDACELNNLELEGVIITVPAYFGSDRVKATKQAGELSKLNVLGTVQEPVAAAVYYGALQSTTDDNILVYDLGGGTFDVSVISIRHEADKNVIEVICNDGDHDLGGRIWDDDLIDYLKGEFILKEGLDEDFEFDLFQEQMLRDAAEETKKQLTDLPSKKVMLRLGGKPVEVKVTREQFDKLTAGNLQRTINLTKDIFENARSKGTEVNRIILVGGSTLMPQVRESLEQNFPGIAVDCTNPHEAVACGAAICALNEYLWMTEKSGQTSGLSLPEPSGGRIEIKQVTSKSFGVGVIQDGNEVIDNLIVKNQPLPESNKPYVVVRDDYGPRYEGQTSAHIAVFENDEEDKIFPKGNRTPSSEGNLDFGGPRNKGDKIEVTFSLSSEGLLSVTATDPKSQKKLELQLKSSDAILDDEAMREEKIRSGELAITS